VRRDSTVQTMTLTDHGALRMAERAGRRGPAADGLVTYLWAIGRKPERHEFAKFGTCQRLDRRYRVAVWQGMWWLMSADVELNKIVTFIDERNQ
jgi:hypothetical protein